MKKQLTEQSKYVHDTCPDYLADSFRSTALSAAKHVGFEAGEKIIREGFSKWPDMIEAELERLKKSLED